MPTERCHPITASVKRGPFMDEYAMSKLFDMASELVFLRQMLKVKR